MSPRLLTAILPFVFSLSTPALAQDLEGDVPGAEGAASPPASDLNDAVDQLSKEHGKPAATTTPAQPSFSPRPAASHQGEPPPPERHVKAKPFAKAKRKPNKVVKKSKAKKGGKAAKKKKH